MSFTWLSTGSKIFKYLLKNSCYPAKPNYCRCRAARIAEGWCE